MQLTIKFGQCALNAIEGVYTKGSFKRLSVSERDTNISKKDFVKLSKILA